MVVPTVRRTARGVPHVLVFRGVPDVLVFRSMPDVLMLCGVPHVLIPCGVLRVLVHRSLLAHRRRLSVVATRPVVLLVWAVYGFGVRRW
ncbi:MULTISPECIES: hypothetical protein [Nocardia]|uniref:hypothetical protein n=1 Tax=Nocardia TaxID=1817 RepID=UPI00082D206F|nr:hypothetical protein [Nocardia ignorata]MBC7299752.1 hypothetical protein [Nocardia sp.]